jgi:peptidoglycan-associated lipoprotein
MIKQIKILIGAIALALLLTPFGLLGQEEGSAEVKGKKSKKEKRLSEEDIKRLIKQGDKRFQNREMVKATQLYRQAFDANSNNFSLAYRIGRCMWYRGEPDSAKEYYEHALQVDPNGNDTLYYDLGIALRKLGLYDESKVALKEFIRRSDEKGIKDEFYTDAKNEIEACDIALELMKKDPEYAVQNISFNSFLPEQEKERLNDINLKDRDFNPVFWPTKADSFLIFTTHRPKNRGCKTYPFTGEKFSDLWYAKMETDSTFGKLENMGKKVNTRANDGAACLDPSGLVMYYSICGGGKIRKYYGCSIYMSEYNEETKKWSKGRKVEGVNGTTTAVINSRGKTKKVPTYDTQPCLSPDGNVMYFVSKREGGQGGHDIWYSQKSGSGWSEPKNAGPVINTEFDELFPSIGADGKTIYFSSDGHKVSYGALDIYKAEGQLDTWTEPQNLGYPLNTSFDDYSLFWMIQDSIGFLASDRKNDKGSQGKIPSYGQDDIWRIKKLPKCQDVKLTAHGRIRDRDSKQVIPFATVTLYKVLADKKIQPIDTFKTSQNGYYEFALEINADYKLVGNAPEYLANEVFVSTKDLPRCKDAELEADIDIFLEGIEIDKPIVLQNIYYDFDKADLRPESIAELEKLLKLLNDNPTIVIQIGSHTDTNGTERYNIKLSDRRAKSVVDFLRQKGIPKERLFSFGFGESDPMIYPELSDADEQANRRTEFRIKSMDYTPSSTNKAQ